MNFKSSESGKNQLANHYFHIKRLRTNAIFCSSGKKEERHYENGVLNGAAVVFGVDGDKFEFTYVDGRIEGLHGQTLPYRTSLGPSFQL
jgi:hypothetical protein